MTQRARSTVTILLLLALLSGGIYGGWRCQSVRQLTPYLTSSYIMADFSGGFPVAGEGTSVEIPPAYELLHVLLALADPDGAHPGAVSQGTAYHQQVMSYFAEHADHPAVELVRGNLDRFPAHRGIFGHVLAEDGSLRLAAGYKHEWLVTAAFGDGLGLLADFAAASDFGGFYERNRAYYEEQIQAYRDAVPLEHMVDWLERNFGLSYESFRVLLSPLTGGTHNTWLLRDSATRQHQAVMFVPAPVNFAGLNLPPELVAGSLARATFTELDHNYVNPTTDLDSNLRLVVRAFEDRAKWYSGPVYQGPGLIFNEYMTWGAFTLWAAEYYDADLAAQLAEQTVQIMLRRGFGLYREFEEELLRVWEARRPGETAADMFGPMLRWALGR